MDQNLAPPPSRSGRTHAGLHRGSWPKHVKAFKKQKLVQSISCAPRNNIKCPEKIMSLKELSFMW